MKLSTYIARAPPSRFGLPQYILLSPAAKREALRDGDVPLFVCRQRVLLQAAESCHVGH